MLSQNATILLQYLKDQRYSKVRLIGEGWSSVVFQADDCIIRIPKHGLQDYKKEQEICNLLRNKVSVLLPRTELCSGEITYIKHKKIRGCNWTQKTINKLSDTEVSLLASDIACFLCTIHQQKTKYIAPSFIPIKLQDLSDTFMCVLDNQLLKEMLDIYKNVTVHPTKSYSLIYGDFSCENTTLTRNNRLYGVFDWCNSGMGDSLFDFVNLYIFFPRYFVSKIINKYQELSNTKFDFSQLKKLYLLRSIYLLYWQHKNLLLESDVLSKKVQEILNKATT